MTGRSGTGKTTYWIRYLLGTKAACKFVFDHEGELAFKLRAKPARSSEELAEAVDTGWCIFDPAVLFPGRTQEGFDFFCDFCFQAATRRPGRKIFACDELQKLVVTTGISLELSTILETGRRYGLDAAMISQQPNLLHNRIRNQLTEVVTFSQIDPCAVDWLQSAGFNPDAVRVLRPGEFIARNLNSAQESTGRVF